MQAQSVKQQGGASKVSQRNVQHTNPAPGMYFPPFFLAPEWPPLPFPPLSPPPPSLQTTHTHTHLECLAAALGPPYAHHQGHLDLAADGSLVSQVVLGDVHLRGGGSRQAAAAAGTRRNACQ
jgi:hypothetical protein